MRQRTGSDNESVISPKYNMPLRGGNSGPEPSRVRRLDSQERLLLQSGIGSQLYASEQEGGPRYGNLPNNNSVLSHSNTFASARVNPVQSQQVFNLLQQEGSESALKQLCE